MPKCQDCGDEKCACGAELCQECRCSCDEKVCKDCCACGSGCECGCAKKTNKQE